MTRYSSFLVYYETLLLNMIYVVNLSTLPVVHIFLVCFRNCIHLFYSSIKIKTESNDEKDRANQSRALLFSCLIYSSRYVANKEVLLESQERSEILTGRRRTSTERTFRSSTRTASSHNNAAAAVRWWSRCSSCSGSGTATLPASNIVATSSSTE